MTRGKFGQGVSDARKQFDLGLRDRVGEGHNALMPFGGDGGGRKMLETGHQGLSKALQSIAMSSNCAMLDTVQMLAHLSDGMDPVIQIGDEGTDGAFEVDIVLPQRVVGVEEESLGSLAVRSDFRWSHSPMLNRVGGATTVQRVQPGTVMGEPAVVKSKSRAEALVQTRRDGRVAEGARLESVYTARYPGFESLSLRQSAEAQFVRLVVDSLLVFPLKATEALAANTMVSVICADNLRNWM